jgi:hypothetical protein
MGIEFRLTDQHLPVSPILIDFLYQFLNKSGRNNNWHDQLNESLHNEAQSIRYQADKRMLEVMQNKIAQKTVNRSYDLLFSILFGLTERLETIHKDLRFILIVGCPRSGGSYLTKHLFQSLGWSVERVPGVIAHDGFPDPVPFSLLKRNNAHTTLARHMAEYIAMAELFFADDKCHDGKIIVPKKATKAAYYGAFFNAALGKDTELIITLRHPLSSCISTYEKSGGFPDNGKFQVRSNIESWVKRDIQFFTGKELSTEDDYFDCYLKYWEYFHNSLAFSGLLANPNITFVPYCGESMMGAARMFYDRLNVDAQIDEFKVFNKDYIRPEWREKGDLAVMRVTEVWGNIGHKFPTDVVMKNY